MRFRSSVAALVFLPLALSGCEKDSAPGPKLEVLDVGTGEKHSLQLDFHGGDVQTADMFMTMDMDIPGMLSMKMEMKFGYEAKVDRVEQKGADKIGHFKFTFTEVDMKVTPSNPEVESLVSTLKQLEGEGLLASIDQKGKQGYVKPVGDRIYPIFKTLGMDSEQVEQMFEDLYPDIPPQPIGVGGSWRIDKKTKQAQNELSVKVTYKLVDAKKQPDGTVECTLDVSGVAKMKGPGGVEGGGDVTGQVVYIPARGRAKSGNVTTTIKAEAQGQTMTMKMSFGYGEKEFRPGP